MTMDKEDISIYKSDWMIDGWYNRVYTLMILGVSPSPKFNEIINLLELFGVSGRMTIQRAGNTVPLVNFTKETLHSFLECCNIQG